MHKASETSVIVEEKCRQVQFLSFLGMQQIVRLRYSPLVGGPTRRPTFVISVASVLLYFFIFYDFVTSGLLDFLLLYFLSQVTYLICYLSFCNQ